MIPERLARLLEPQERCDARQARAARLGSRLVDLSYANFDGPLDPGVRAVLADALATDRSLAFQYTPFGGSRTARRAVADALGFDWRSVVLTNGAAAALTIVLRAVGAPGDEVVVPVPCWLDHPLYVEAGGLRPVLVPLAPGPGFDLDADAVGRALGARTAAVVLGNPGNPTGRAYDDATLARLGRVLADAERRFGRPVTLVADETHRDLAGPRFTSAADHHPHTVVVYSFGKYHALQGQRLGYAAVPPGHPDRAALGAELVRWVRICGNTSPTSLMQMAVPGLLGLRHDTAERERWRERYVTGLGAAGYEVVAPDVSHYVYVRTPPPLPDEEWVETLLRDHRVLVLPAAVFHHEGWFRLSLTATPASLAAGLAALQSAAARWCPGGRAEEGLVQPEDPRSGGRAPAPQRGLRVARPRDPGPGEPIRERSRFRLIGPPDPAFAWDGVRLVEGVPARAPQEGAFAGLAHGGDGEGEAVRLGRDPLGLGKLFWVTAADGTVELAARPARLTDRGHPLDACAALPAGTLVTYRPGAATPEVTPLTGPRADGDGDGHGDVGGSVEAIAEEIHDVTARYLQAVLAARPGPVVVCLSGGLDSTSVAALVREHRDDAVAVTFDLASPDDASSRSDDFVAAEAAARHLGLDLVPAVHTTGRLFELLDTVLVAGIDWRDFNVHAGLVNAGLALSIAELVGDRRADTTVFTGDLVNELLADYHSETYKGRTYYRLPRLPIARTRDALVRGLATSHREVGVFAELGLTVVQPYAAARRQFLRLPDDVLGPGPGKARLYRAMFGETLPRSCYERPKTRAQTGSTTGGRGVLGACADAGLDERHLADRFDRLHGLDDPAALGRFLRAGRYRTAVPLT